MLIAEKRRAGFCEVTDRVRNYGITRRAASMADFLVMHDPSGLTEDPRDLERPRGLPKLRRNHSGLGGPTASHNQNGIHSCRLRSSTTMQMPSAAHGISAGGGLSQSMRNVHNRPQAKVPDRQAAKWQPAAEPGIAAEVEEGTGEMQEFTGSEVSDEMDQSIDESALEDDLDSVSVGDGAAHRCVCSCRWTRVEY